jgi:hypothetical protein
MEVQLSRNDGKTESPEEGTDRSRDVKSEKSDVKSETSNVNEEIEINKSDLPTGQAGIPKSEIKNWRYIIRIT